MEEWIGVLRRGFPTPLLSGGDRVFAAWSHLYQSQCQRQIVHAFFVVCLGRVPSSARSALNGSVCRSGERLRLTPRGLD